MIAKPRRKPIRKAPRPFVQCSSCPRETDQPRRGKCFGCYLRERRGSSLPYQAACKECGEDDPIVLRVTPFGILCANHHARARAVA
jgi:hypothetical protein